MENFYFKAYQDHLNMITVEYHALIDSFYVNHILYPAKMIQKNDFYYIYQIELPLEFEKTYIISDKFFNHIEMERRYIVKDPAFDDYFYYDKEDLGVQYHPSQSQFKVWAPLSSEGYIKYYLDGKVYIEPLNYTSKGVWEGIVTKDLKNALYLYLLKTNGKWVEVVDPYCYSCNANGQYGAVIDLLQTQIPLYEEQLTPCLKNTDAIIYEMSVRDFSSDNSLGEEVNNRYLAFCKENIKTVNQHPIGIDYLSFLGITHVQLMPITDFATVDENDVKKFYNWGYDPFLWNCFEGSYSTNPNNPYQRILEVKKMIQALHKKNIRVVLDLVFNHFYYTKNNVLNLLVPNYFLQMDKSGHLSNGSFCGNDYDSSTKMGQKYILDLAKRLVKEYQIDGFRLDLMGILTKDMVLKMYHECKKINPSFILYGEGWNMPSMLDESKRASLLHAKEMLPIAFFNDYFRDIVKGKNFDRELQEKGYVNGNTGFVYEMIKAMKGSVDPYCYFDDASQSINYVECHDNATLHDKLLISNPDYDDATRNQILLCCLACTIFALGIPFLHAGIEFHRSKQGKTNTYNEPDSINAIHWQQLDQYFDNCLALKDFIALRKRYHIFSMHRFEDIQKHFHYAILEHQILKISYQNLQEIDGIEELVFFINPTDKILHFQFDQYFKMICSEHGLIRNDVYCSNININPFSFSMYIKEIK